VVVEKVVVEDGVIKVVVVEDVVILRVW